MDEMQQDAPAAPGPLDPMTIPERIQQLNEVDKHIVLLMSHTAEAVNALASSSAASSASSASSPAAAAATSAANDDGPSSTPGGASFKSSMDALLSTLHTVDVRLKRQIWALEEAGIIKLSASDSSGGGGSGRPGGPGSSSIAPAADAESRSAARSSLEPNGVGSVGGLDVGWLNSRSSKVERDMEAELWAKARRLLEGLVDAEVGGDEMES